MGYLLPINLWLIDLVLVSKRLNLVILGSFIRILNHTAKQQGLIPLNHFSLL